MDFPDRIKAVAARAEKQRASVQTEEACKNAFVMPFLNALGFDVFDPEVVIPEFTADVGLKKGEKVDYALKIGGKISVLVECKGCGTNLANIHMSQLYRYFSVTDARFAILTNGIEYWFFSDLDAPNKMDQRPFFQFDLLNHRADDLAELQKFRCEHFDESVILSTASNLKYSSAIKSEFLKEISQPSEEFMKILVSRVFEGSFTQKVKDKFAPLVGAAIRDAVRDMVNERLTSALEVSSGARPPVMPVSEIAVPQAVAVAADPEVVTTDEEVEAFHIIKALVRSTIKADRIVMRDAKTYCAILVDDNNRRPLARLHFNSKSIKYLGLFSGKDEERIRIETLEDIYGYAERLQQTAATYQE